MDLNHILLFIAVISPLLVLVRAWRPGGTHRGWRIAAAAVLAVSLTSWIFFRDDAGYIGGGAWFILLLLPAIGLKKAAQLAAEGRYKSARRLAALLAILHPTQEVHEQVRIFRILESRAASGSGISPQRLETRPRRLNAAPAVFTIIVLNTIAFVFELSHGDLNDPQILHQLGALDWDDVVVGHEYWRLLSALFIHAGFIHLGFNLFALYVLGPATGENNWQFAIRCLLFGFRVGFFHRRGRSDSFGFGAARRTGRRFRMHDGNRRCLGRIFISKSTNVAGKERLLNI